MYTEEELFQLTETKTVRAYEIPGHDIQWFSWEETCIFCDKPCEWTDSRRWCDTCNGTRGTRLIRRINERRYYRRHKQKAIKKSRKRNDTQPRKDYAKEYYLKNKDKLIQQHKDYYYNNKEKRLAKIKEYHLKHIVRRRMLERLRDRRKAELRIKTQLHVQNTNR